MRFPKRARAFAAGLAGVLFGVTGGVACACSVCGCGDPLVVAGDSAPHPQALRLALDAEYLTAQAASDDNPRATESVVQSTLRPTVVFSPLEAVNWVLQVPLVRKAWSLQGGEARAATSKGLGDIDLGARWFIWQPVNLQRMQRQELALSAGSALPTGAANGQLEGRRLDDHAQLGTGAFAPYLGILYARHRDPWNLTLDVSGRAHTLSRFDYRYGPALLSSARGTFLVREGLGLVAGVDGRFAGRDTAGGFLQQNTGGLVLAAVPGVSVQLWQGLWFMGRAQLPFFSHLFGRQSLGPVITGSLQYAFAQ